MTAKQNLQKTTNKIKKKKTANKVCKNKTKDCQTEFAKQNKTKYYRTLLQLDIMNQRAFFMLYEAIAARLKKHLFSIRETSVSRHNGG